MSTETEILKASKQAQLLKDAESNKLLRDVKFLIEIMLEKMVTEKFDVLKTNLLGDIESQSQQIAETMVKAIEPNIIANMTSTVEQEIEYLTEVIKQGRPGEPGLQGLKGLPGDSGKDGKPGKDGRDGKNGIDGLNGKNGDPGPRGENGKDGSPDTPEQIAMKLNTLVEVVDVSVIKGWSKIIRGIQRSIAEKKIVGGGGMGAWVHEFFNTSSATTNVTVSQGIAANGSAIMVRYMGQMLAYGVQYTVSGKVITFTFVLDDASTVDISYVRT